MLIAELTSDFAYRSKVPGSRTPSLRTRRRPKSSQGGKVVRIVDLFAGCGGLTLGIQQAADRADFRLEVSLAVDFDEPATDVYRANFPKARVLTRAVETLFDGELGTELTMQELELRASTAGVDALVGGPPCQGHSNLNNKTRRRDPKNELYARMGRAAEVLRPKIVVIENVPSVRLDTDQVVRRTTDHLTSLGYTVGTTVVSLGALGVAQTRRRHILVASREKDIKPNVILERLSSGVSTSRFDLRWAIGDLANMSPDDYQKYDVPAKPSQANSSRMKYLLESGNYDLPDHLRPPCHRGGNHSYKSMYGRLRWDRPAQTITSGFGSIGQGRYMHPEMPRALTAHEAARIQGFPDYFSFEQVSRRSDVATMIGNAVPPALTRELFAAVLHLLAK